MSYLFNNKSNAVDATNYSINAYNKLCTTTKKVK